MQRLEERKKKKELAKCDDIGRREGTADYKNGQEVNYNCFNIANIYSAN